MKILIIGAGIIGLTTAYFLVRRGYSVLVVEQESAIGTVSSYMNGGQFSYSYAEPLASPSMPRQLPAILFGRHAALKIKPAAFTQLMPWGLQFLRNCTIEKFTENTQTVLRLAKLSREEMGHFINLHVADFSFRETGKLHLYQDSNLLQRTASLVELKNRLGFMQEIWNSEQCLNREPALNGYQGPLAGGIFSPLDQSGDTYELIQSLQEVCLQSGQCEFRTNTTVNGFDVKASRIAAIKTTKEDLSADGYVVSAGAASPQLMKKLGIKLPIMPVKGYSITVPALPQAPEINLTDTKFKIVFTKLGEQLRVAGLMEFAGHDRHIRKDRIEYLLGLAKAALPQAGDYQKLLSCWAGLRPMTPDGIPLIGPTRWQNLWLNAGHGMLGSTLAFGSARLIADLIDGADTPIDRTNFHPGRF